MTVEEPVPYKEFIGVLGLLASIGLAASAPSAFSMIGVTTLFGDASPSASAEIRRCAELLSWASTCFTIALGLVITLQLFYTDGKLAEMIRNPNQASNQDVKNETVAGCVITSVGILAWMALGFQGAGMVLISQSWSIISPISSITARYGLIGGVVAVVSTALLADTASRERMAKATEFVDKMKKWI